jgi:hypothetical protein
MLMRGDLQKIFDQINPVFEGVDKRLKKVEEALPSKKPLKSLKSLLGGLKRKKVKIKLPN